MAISLAMLSLNMKWAQPHQPTNSISSRRGRSPSSAAQAATKELERCRPTTSRMKAAMFCFLVLFVLLSLWIVSYLSRLVFVS
ncbi:hypothetical protein DENSPDRAFT_844429 [Dentipellis sp. KUC8613]|nr:hypothetical protein DENSPDRAFT_844429 [Dentipellis sp. KUC8613]